MFTNLKNKLIEEVKASPSKFQQFANAAQAAVSSSSSTTPSGSESTNTTNENFFSITEEDTPQNSPYKPLRLPAGALRGGATNTSPQNTNNGANTGAIPRTRRLSNSSIASDISFRLPSYDAALPAYHLQSDLESSVSEVEDSASTVKLETITKEQLYDAYKKSLDRYHKYRCRYADLAKKYKDLERDSTKARSVLVETQEKAIRRISELREQCTLEQQAKAHLEEALRMEMDDMQCKMQAYQTKLKVLGENPEQIATVLAAGDETLIDLNPNEHEKLNGSIINVFASDAGDLTKHLQQKLAESELKLQAMTKKFEESLAENDLLRKQEEENALLLAQTKQAIYSELESKDSEVKQLQDAKKKLQSELQNAVNNEQKRSVQAKQELNAKLIASEHLLAELKEKYYVQEKALAAAEEKLECFKKESEQIVSDIRQENAQLNDMVERYQRNEISLAEIDNELNRTKNENDTLRACLEEQQQRIQDLESKAKTQQETYELCCREKQFENETKLAAAELKLLDYNKQFEDHRAENERMAVNINELEAKLQIASARAENSESKKIGSLQQEFEAIKEQLASKEKELKAMTNKLTKQRKQHESQQAKIKEQTDVIEKLKHDLGEHEQLLQAMQEESREREVRAESEKNILHQIADMEQQMRVVQQSHFELDQEKQSLESKIENMQRKSQDAERWQEQLVATKENLTQVETKLQHLESENSRLTEKNCLLEENSNRLEKLIADKERQQTAEDEATASDMRLKLETSEGALQKLNDKLAQVLDENSRMHNAQELMEHDHRTLQDKCDALEKEKLAAIDMQTCLEEQKQALEVVKIAAEAKLQEMLEQLKINEEKLVINKEQLEEKQNNVQSAQSKLKQLQEQLEYERTTFKEQLNASQVTQSNEVLELRKQLQEFQQRLHGYKNMEQTLQAVENELKVVREKLDQAAKDLERSNEVLLLQRDKNKSLNEELQSRNDEMSRLEYKLQTTEERLSVVKESLQKAQEDLKLKQEAVEALQDSHSNTVIELKEQLHEKQQFIQELESNALATETKLRTLQDELKKTIETLEHKTEESILLRESNERLKEELTSGQNELQKKQVILADMQVKLQDFESNQSGEIHALKSNVADLKELLAASKKDYNALVTKEHELEEALKISSLAYESTLQELQEFRIEVGKLQEAEKQSAIKLSNFEQLRIENEYLNKHVRQLESDLEQQKQSSQSADTDTDELKQRLKSIQCELYVLQENADKHNIELEEKQKHLMQTLSQLDELRQTNELERVELNRQREHACYISEQNDSVQKELLHAQQQVADLEHKNKKSTEKLLTANLELAHLKQSTDAASDAKEQQLHRLSAELMKHQQTIEALQKEVSDQTALLSAQEKLALELEEIQVESVERSVQVPLESYPVTNVTQKTSLADAEHLRQLNATLQRELEDLKFKSSTEIVNLQQEIEDMQSTAKHLTEKMGEYERLRTEVEQQQQQQQQQILNSNATITINANDSAKDNNHEIKLKSIMQEVQDVSNRNIFLEQKCENYLILEQSNERLKLQNSKLSRQLDETLVSMQHNESISANTEFEYLKNIMFQYLTGSTSGNNETLVKVISAVLKFSPQQTQVAIEKEHQRRSLLNKIL